jgi:hypothetical protein
LEVFKVPKAFDASDEVFPGLKAFQISTFAPLLAEYVSTPEYTAPSDLGLRIAATYSFAWPANGLTWEEAVPWYTKLWPTALVAFDGAALVVLGPALVAFDGAALVAFDGPALLAFLDGPALVAFWANACCDSCIPAIVKDVSSIAEIAIADSVGTFALEFKHNKAGVSASAPKVPENSLHSLPATLRMLGLKARAAGLLTILYYA